MKHAIALIALSLCAGTALAQPAAKTDVRSNDEPAELTRLPASRILLDTLEISGGRLVVSGVTPLPNRQVRLDQRYFAMSNDIGRFNFSLPYLPPDCIVELKIGALADQAVVANCGLQGERGIQGLAGRRGARGAAGSAGPQGVTGPAGPQGERGVPGPAGPQGSQGAPGAAGSGGGLKVVDANGQRVGVWYGSASVLVDINGGMFRVGVNRDGFRGADGCDGKCPPLGRIASLSCCSGLL